MGFASIYAARRNVLSFEFFPPQTESGERSLYQHVERLLDFQPDYVTCTYGAGGSTRDKTLKIVTELKRRWDVPVASHLTLVGSTVDQLCAYLRRVADARIENIVALRGDPPRGAATFEVPAGGLRYANELVALIRREFPQFGIAVGGYPETHREAPSPKVDLENLRRKVDAGADVVITQLFFRNADYFAFVERCRGAGIRAPIVPGILPVTSLAQAARLTSMCGASMPPDLLDALARSSEAAQQRAAGIAHSIAQVRELVARGVPGLHFYVLNQSGATGEVLQAVAEWRRGPDPTSP
jgi:methylenetetrahydrofolate reductase (NADPH)